MVCKRSLSLKRVLFGYLECQPKKFIGRAEMTVQACQAKYFKSDTQNTKSNSRKKMYQCYQINHVYLQN